MAPGAIPPNPILPSTHGFWSQLTLNIWFVLQAFTQVETECTLSIDKLDVLREELRKELQDEISAKDSEITELMDQLKEQSSPSKTTVVL